MFRTRKFVLLLRSISRMLLWSHMRTSSDVKCSMPFKLSIPSPPTAISWTVAISCSVRMPSLSMSKFPTKFLKFSSGKYFASTDTVVLPALTTVIVNSCDVDPELFEASTMNVYLPSVEGTPEINPASLSVRPSGRLPVHVHVIGAVPVAVSCME